MSTEKAYNSSTPSTKGRTLRWASFYDAVVRLLSFGKDKAIRRKTVEFARISPGDYVLDVGCGTGDLTIAAKKIAGPNGNVIGTDASPEMIQVARRKAERDVADVTFRVDLIENISYPDNHFDLVLSSLMMHHLPEDLKSRGLAEIYRVLKPGGRLLIVDMESSSGGSWVYKFSDFMIQLHGGHTRMKDYVKKLVPLVERTGFTNVETDRINRQLSFISGKKRLAK